MVSSPVTGLFYLSGPAAIPRLIAAVIVNPFDRMVWAWARTHGLIKCLKGVLPSESYCNPSSAIAMISRVLGIQAPRQHISPHRVFGSFRNHLQPPAATRNGFPGQKISFKHFSNTETLTAAKPNLLASFILKPSWVEQRPPAHHIPRLQRHRLSLPLDSQPQRLRSLRVGGFDPGPQDLAIVFCDGTFEDL